LHRQQNIHASSATMQNILNMKQIALLLFISLVFVNCTHKLTVIELRDYKSIEGVKIGMEINTAIELVKKKYFVEKSEIPTYEGEEKEYEYIVYTDATKKTALFSFNPGYDKQTHNTVYRLVIKNPKYRTVEGLCTGMTVKELKEKNMIKSVDFNLDDGLFISSNKFDGGFFMDLKSVKDNELDYENPQINTLPGVLKIKEIMIF
jgi:hypothetical protein